MSATAVVVVVAAADVVEAPLEAGADDAGLDAVDDPGADDAAADVDGGAEASSFLLSQAATNIPTMSATAARRRPRRVEL